MPSTANLDLQVPRNGDYYEEWALEDIDGSPIDLTGHTLAMDARAVAGDSSVIASAALSIPDPTDGHVIVRWQGSDFDAFGNVFALTRASYDLKDTYPDGIVQVPVRGFLLIIPEVTV